MDIQRVYSMSELNDSVIQVILSCGSFEDVISKERICSRFQSIVSSILSKKTIIAEGKYYSKTIIEIAKRLPNLLSVYAECIEIAFPNFTLKDWDAEDVIKLAMANQKISRFDPEDLQVLMYIITVKDIDPRYDASNIEYFFNNTEGTIDRLRKHGLKLKTSDGESNQREIYICNSNNFPCHAKLCNAKYLIIDSWKNEYTIGLNRLLNDIPLEMLQISNCNKNEHVTDILRIVVDSKCRSLRKITIYNSIEIAHSSGALLKPNHILIKSDIIHPHLVYDLLIKFKKIRFITTDHDSFDIESNMKLLWNIVQLVCDQFHNRNIVVEKKFHPPRPIFWCATDMMTRRIRINEDLHRRINEWCKKRED